jgi:Ca2+-transporting ATPase
MQRPPRDTNARLFGGATLAFALLQGAGALVVVLATYGWGLQQMTEEQARAFGFCALVVANLALILSNRSHHVSLLASLRQPNRTLWIVTAATTGLLLLVVAVPALAGLFRFAALPWPAVLALPVLAAVAALWFELIRRGFARRLHRPR